MGVTKRQLDQACEWHSPQPNPNHSCSGPVVYCEVCSKYVLVDCVHRLTEDLLSMEVYHNGIEKAVKRTNDRKIQK